MPCITAGNKYLKCLPRRSCVSSEIHWHHSLSLSLLFYLQPGSLSLCNHILYTIGSQSNLMHRYSLIKLICGDSLFLSVLNSFMPPYQNTHTHSCSTSSSRYVLRWQLRNQLKCHAVHGNVTPNYFLISLKQLFHIQHNQSLIGGTKQRRLDNKTTNKNVQSEIVTGSFSVQFICQPKLDRARRGYWVSFL